MSHRKMNASNKRRQEMIGLHRFKQTGLLNRFSLLGRLSKRRTFSHSSRSLEFVTFVLLINNMVTTRADDLFAQLAHILKTPLSSQLGGDWNSTLLPCYPPTNCGLNSQWLATEKIVRFISQPSRRYWSQEFSHINKIRATYSHSLVCWYGFLRLMSRATPLCEQDTF